MLKPEELKEGQIWHYQRGKWSQVDDVLPEDYQDRQKTLRAIKFSGPTPLGKLMNQRVEIAYCTRYVKEHSTHQFLVDISNDVAFMESVLCEDFPSFLQLCRELRDLETLSSKG